MAHYLDIHSIDKELVKGVKVISFVDDSPFKDNMKEVLRVVRCSFNSVFRRYFDVNSEWDCDYFVITVDRIHWLIEELKREYAKGDDSDIYDEEDYGKVMSCLSALSHEPDSGVVYLISWDK